MEKSVVGEERAYKGPEGRMGMLHVWTRGELKIS